MAIGTPIWELSSFRSLFADPFAEGNELENAGHAAEALLVSSRKAYTLRPSQGPPPLKRSRIKNLDSYFFLAQFGALFFYTLLASLV